MHFEKMDLLRNITIVKKLIIHSFQKYFCFLDGCNIKKVTALRKSERVARFFLILFGGGGPRKKLAQHAATPPIVNADHGGA